MPSPEPIRVAVIDSGVHSSHPHIDAVRLAPGVVIASDGTARIHPPLDRLGHGTAVTAAIQSLAPDAICIPVRVFDDRLATRAGALIAAIEWSVGAGADLINLSLGSTNTAHRAPFEAAVASAAAAGVAVVAARAAGGMPCWPGSGAGAIGVVVADLPRGQWQVDGAGFAASGEPRPIDGVPPAANLRGISFAVANMTGIAARLLTDTAMPRRPARLDALRRALADDAAARVGGHLTVDEPRGVAAT
jgi:subtilisin family serine protease